VLDRAIELAAAVVQAIDGRKTLCHLGWKGLAETGSLDTSQF
jgi:hypothetical protein